MTIAIHELPSDVAELKRLVVQERQLLADREAQIARIRAEAAAEIARIEAERQAAIDAAVKETVDAAVEAAVQAAVAAILRRYYGPRSERFDPRQLLLFGRTVDQLPLDEASVAEEAGQPLATRRVQRRDRHGRQQLPEHLERIEIEHDLAEDAKCCPACGGERSRIGAEVSEQLEYFPASFKVFKHIRHKYACGRCEHDGYDPQIASAAKPPQPIEKGLPGPSLLAYVAVSKLADHLPLYRLENIFHRQKLHVARSTMCGWMRCAGELVRPLVELMTARIKQSRVIHTDDTTVPIQSPGQPRCRQGRIWCYLGDEANPYTVYDYTPNRKRDGPARWLAGYGGYLQADAYGGYDGIFHGQAVKEVACWAHARRKFYDAQDSDARRSAEMLALVGELYRIEREAQAACAGVWSTLARDEQHARTQTLRQERSVPVLARIKDWLDVEQDVVLPLSPLGQAITYARNQWTALNEYVTQGFLAIDNNASERALKPVAIGRKNWLFAGNDEAAASHARLWSLIASCQRHGVCPQRYLTSVLAKIGATPADQLDQFLPERWKQEDAAEPHPAD